MTDDSLRDALPVSRAALEAAAAISCCRFGNAEGEARRRGRVTALARYSQELAQALQDFARSAGQHARGAHATADMRPEADTLASVFEAWSFTVNAAAALQPECLDDALPGHQDAVPSASVA